MPGSIYLMLIRYYDSVEKQDSDFYPVLRIQDP